MEPSSHFNTLDTFTSQYPFLFNPVEDQIEESTDKFPSYQIPPLPLDETRISTLSKHSTSISQEEPSSSSPKIKFHASSPELLTSKRIRPIKTTHDMSLNTLITDSSMPSQNKVTSHGNSSIPPSPSSSIEWPNSHQHSLLSTSCSLPAAAKQYLNPASSMEGSSAKKKREIPPLALPERKVHHTLEISHKRPQTRLLEKIEHKHPGGLPSPKRKHKDLDLTESLKESKLKEIELDQRIPNTFTEIWESTPSKPTASAEKLDNIIYRLCREKIFNYINYHGEINFWDLYNLITSRSPIILKNIQETHEILNDITIRLKIFYRAMKTWNLSATHWDDKLYQQLRTLKKYKNLKMGQFWHHCKEFTSKTNRATYAIICKAFGDTTEQAGSVLDTIRIWSAVPDNFLRYSSNPSKKLYTLSTKFNAHIIKGCAEIILAKKAVFDEHQFSIKNKDITTFENISPHEIRRSIFPDRRLLFDKISINDEVFHIDRTINLEDKVHKSRLSYSQFWRALFKHIYKYFNPLLNNKSINEQAELFLSPSNSPRQKDSDKIIISPKELEAKIPCLLLLKLMTNNCWLRGDTYFREFFPTISVLPYGLSINPGIECSISILSSDNFSVSQKKYSLFADHLIQMILYFQH